MCAIPCAVVFLIFEGGDYKLFVGSASFEIYIFLVIGFALLSNRYLKLLHSLNFDFAFNRRVSQSVLHRARPI